MANRDPELNRAATRPFRVTRAGIERLAAIAVAVAAAVALVYGESWAIERAPASEVANGLAQTADLKGALDTVLAARTHASSPAAQL